MAGRTGKLTREALAVRGPRLVLASIEHEFGARGMVIFREGQEPWSFRCSDFFTGAFSVRTVAKSYTMSYLIRIAKGNQ